jgi:hypothetical protein
MDLFILILIFAVIGFILANVRSGGGSAKNNGSAKKNARKWTPGTGDRWTETFGSRGLTDDFRAWVYGAGADALNEDFKKWFARLVDRDARSFVLALTDYTRSLGISLPKSVRGGLEHEPIMRQVFVEAIVVYSQAYRKAKQALKEAEAQAEKKAAPDGNEIEKSAAKRSNLPSAETAEAAPAA